MAETRKRQGERRVETSRCKKERVETKRETQVKGGLKLEGGLEGQNLEGGEAKVRVDSVRAQDERARLGRCSARVRR